MVHIITAADGSTLRVSDASWLMALYLARGAGWKPGGTAEPDNWPDVAPARGPDGLPAPWRPGIYAPWLGQRLSDEDADRLADALERAMDDIPDHDAMAHKVCMQIETNDGRRWRMIAPDAVVMPFEYFSGNNKRKLWRLIRICRLGGFTLPRDGRSEDDDPPSPPAAPEQPR